MIGDNVEMDSAETNDSRSTIRGDQLLLAFQCLERYCARRVTPQFLERHFEGRDYTEIDHPFGFIHWIGEMAIRAHVRNVIDSTMNEVARHEAPFTVELVVRHAIEDASPAGLGELGLSENDRAHFTEILTRFFNAVACGEIAQNKLEAYASQRS